MNVSSFFLILRQYSKIRKWERQNIVRRKNKKQKKNPMTEHFNDRVIVFIVVRLVQGRTARDGRVEVRRSGAWGSVCGELWDLVDANVLCRLLGYNEALAYYQNITFKQSNNTLWLTDVQCVGNESSLFHCVNSGWGKRTCNEGLAAGATCSDRSWGEFCCCCW